VETRFFGRDHEVLQLTTRLQTERGLIIIRGEAGVGKTRLIQESLRVARYDSTVVWGRPEQVTRPGPYGLILDVVEDLIRRLKQPEVAESLGSVGERLLSPGHESETDLPLRRLAAELRGALAQLGSHPMAILEDLHQADEASLAIVLMLARTAREDGYTLIATFREEEVEGNNGLERLIDITTRERLSFHIELAPLDVQTSRLLASELLGPSASAELMSRLLTLGEGIPFYLEELADSYGQGASAFPKSVSRSTSLRLRRLGTAAKPVVQFAALMSGYVDPSVLAVALDVEPSTVDRALVEAMHIGLLIERESRLVFRHSLVREALIDDLSMVERRTIHQQLATTIETVYHDDLESHAPRLAVHWYEAHDLPKALEYGLLAGQHALTLAALADARRAFELALASSPERRPSPSALVGLAEVSRREGDLGEAAELFQRASFAYQLDGVAELAARAVADAAWMIWLAKRDPQVLEAIERALDMVSGTDNSLRATLLTRKGKVLAGLGRMREVRPVLTAALEAAQGSHDDMIQADVLEALATYLVDFHNDMAAYHEYSQAACQRALLSGNAELIGRTHNNRALTLILREDIASGLACLEVARERLERSYGASGLAIVRLTEAIARWRLGQPPLVEEALGKSALSLALFGGWVRILRAWSSVHLGDVEQAQRIAEAGWAELGQSSDEVTRSITSEAAAETALCVLLLSTELQSPEGFEVCDAVTHYYGNRHEGLLAVSLGARSAVLAGEIDRGRQLLDDAENLLKAIPSPYLRAHVTETMGCVSEAQGQIGQAGKAYMTARHLYAEFGNVVDAGRCIRLAAEVNLRNEAQGGNFESTISELRDALHMVSLAGSTLEITRVESRMRELGARPRAGRPRKNPSTPPDALSPREEQVSALVAVGLTNGEIAARLYLSERTVQDHITHALRKLQLPGRAALAAWAVRNHRI